jgi:hypothetical protein
MGGAVARAAKGSTMASTGSLSLDIFSSVGAPRRELSVISPSPYTFRWFPSRRGAGVAQEHVG